VSVCLLLFTACGDCLFLVVPDVPGVVLLREGLASVNGSVTVNCQALGQHLCRLSLFNLQSRTNILLHCYLLFIYDLAITLFPVLVDLKSASIEYKHL